MKKIIYIILLLTLSGVELKAGGGWVHSKGTGFLKLSEWWVIANSHYTGNGIDPNITSGIFNAILYAEYGISDRLEAIVYFPFFSRAYTNDEVSGTTGNIITPGDAINSIGDTDIGIKYAIIKDKPFVLSASLILGIPLGKSDAGNRGILETGDGEFNQLLIFDVSTSKTWRKFNTFYSLYFGFNNRTKGFSDELRFGLEVGAIYWKQFIGIYRIQVQESLKNSTFAESNGATIFASDSEFVSYTYELGYEFKEKYGITFNVGGAFSGSLIFANKSYSVGLYMKL